MFSGTCESRCAYIPTLYFLQQSIFVSTIVSLSLSFQGSDFDMSRVFYFRVFREMSNYQGINQYVRLKKPFYLKSATSETGLILVAFITGNSSLEPLIEGLYAQIHVNLR